MEATPAPMGEDTATPEPDVQPDTSPEEAPKQDDYQARLDQRLQEMSDAQKQQADEFRQWRESQTAPEEDDPDLLEEGDDGYDEQQAELYLQKLVQQQVQERLAPLEKQQANERRDTAYNDFVSKFPEFKNEETAKKYIASAVEELEDLNPNAIEDQRLVKLVERMYKADKADERAAQETPPQRTTSLESGGGAAPAESGEEVQDRLIRAYEANNTQI